MAKSFKYKDNMYLDTKGIVHNRKVLADILYPVGSVYLSVNSTNPKNIMGGEWTLIDGAFLLTVDPNTSMAHKTSKVRGGDWKTGSTALTVNQIPAHSHTLNYHVLAGNSGGWNVVSQSGGYWSSDNGNTRATNTGGGQGHTHSLTPPYFTVYAWYRTA